MIRLAIRVARDQAELVLAELAELAPGRAGGARRRHDTVEYAIYGAPGELPAMPDLRAAAGGALVEVSTTELADDWDVRWRTWHPAVVVEAHGGRCACARRGRRRSPGRSTSRSSRRRPSAPARTRRPGSRWRC
jgi:hypothetical protein